MLEAYRWCQQGHLPRSGTWLDQPAPFVDAVGVVDKAMADADEHERREEERAAKVARQKGNTRPGHPARRWSARRGR